MRMQSSPPPSPTVTPPPKEDKFFGLFITPFRKGGQKQATKRSPLQKNNVSEGADSTNS
jgi:hypothetical protein